MTDSYMNHTLINDIKINCTTNSLKLILAFCLNCERELQQFGINGLL